MYNKNSVLEYIFIEYNYSWKECQRIVDELFPGEGSGQAAL